MAAPPAKGHLVVAAPTLEDPNFHRSVVLLLAADDDGALRRRAETGPSDTLIGEIVPTWASLAPVRLFSSSAGPSSRMRPSAWGKVPGGAR